ncbi:helix-turn-helix transcriptional regulator [Halocalculus aciditolerans]|uniref:HTH iclR-type domain-containing protein n=1 Tax=Halocalculus aciditolerans TaxID=1383812 RepID=A0A830FHD5_9EURY|nr:hypothetical protein [Halocalculus aciditolerans]GGL56226.1 hypothetical protein GCM10009039_12970 [Halocalculus aciditolerans]
MTRVLAGLLTAFAVLGLALTGAATPAAAATNQTDFDSVHYTVTVHENGSARWTFTYQTALDNESQRQAFRTYADRFEANETALYQSFRTRATDLVADGQNATGRSMTATHFSRDAAVRGLNDDLGVIEMSFTWTGFARVDGDRVIVGDLFDGGLYIADDQRFVVTAAPGLDFATAEPTPDALSGTTLADSDTLTWLGERQFTDERPRIVLTTANTTTPGTTALTTTGTTLANGDTGDGGVSPLLLLAGVLLAALLGIAATASYYTRHRDAPSDASTDTPPADVAAEPAVSDADLLTDDRRVINLLEDHGGRMRQASIVDETDWSKSKVSMLLSDMEDDDRITRLRIGRENVVSLPGHEPDAARDNRPDPDPDE